MISSKLSVKSQTVIPTAVRQHLGIGPGDSLEYDLVDGAVIVRPKRAASRLSDNPFATFEEWASEADEEAYADL